MGKEEAQGAYVRAVSEFWPSWAAQAAVAADAAPVRSKPAGVVGDDGIEYDAEEESGGGGSGHGPRVSRFAAEEEEEEGEAQELNALLLAADRGDVAAGRAALDTDPALLNAVGESGMTAMHYAALGEAWDFCAMLVERGADTSVRDDDGKTAADYGWKRLQ